MEDASQKKPCVANRLEMTLTRKAIGRSKRAQASCGLDKKKRPKRDGSRPGIAVWGRPRSRGGEGLKLKEKPRLKAKKKTRFLYAAKGATNGFIGGKKNAVKTNKGMAPSRPPEKKLSRRACGAARSNAR